MSTIRAKRRHRGVLLLAAAVTLLGCVRSDGLVEVHGTVTLDGQPLNDAIVQFMAASHEQGTSRPAVGRTDSGGYYQLEYSTGVTGTRPGKYKVTISTFWPSSLTPEEEVIPGSAERVPNVYNTRSTLTADVTAEEGEVNFDLKSDAGPIVQPGGKKP
jgi:hypothetical protein